MPQINVVCSVCHKPFSYVHNTIPKHRRKLCDGCRASRLRTQKYISMKKCIWNKYTIPNPNDKKIWYNQITYGEYKAVQSGVWDEVNILV